MENTQDNDITEIKKLLYDMNIKLDIVSCKIIEVNNKCDNLLNKFDSEVITECKKMGSHIDFVESVYENIKHPLSYICNKINYHSIGEMSPSAFHITNQNVES